jgi:hypothetical protein
MTVGLNIYALIALLFATTSLGALFGYIVCALCMTSADAESIESDREQETFQSTPTREILM